MQLRWRQSFRRRRRSLSRQRSPPSRQRRPLCRWRHALFRWRQHHPAGPPIPAGSPCSARFSCYPGGARRPHISTDIIPSGDAAFDTFQKQFIGAVAADPTKYGVTPSEITSLQSGQAAWTKAYPAHVDAKAGALTASKAKGSARTTLEGDIRLATKKINGTATVDDAARVAAGLKAHDQARTAAPAPATRPIARLEATGHAALTIHFADSATPTLRAKPHGIHGAEIWSHVGDPAPADPSGYTFVALDTRTPYLDEHPAADGGKTVYYLLRWQNTKGEHGPWSDVISTKIPV